MAVDWDAIEADVDADGYVTSLTGVETRYARLESVATSELAVAFEADDGDIGHVQIRVPWEMLREIMARRDAGRREAEILVLTREVDQIIKIGEDIYVTVLDVRPGGKVRLGITAPREVPVLRTELLNRGRDEALRGGRA